MFSRAFISCVRWEDTSESGGSGGKAAAGRGQADAGRLRTPGQRVRIQTVFSRVHWSKALVDFSTPPNPDCFQPPKGVVRSPSL